MGIQNRIVRNKMPEALEMLLVGAQASQLAGANAHMADMIHELTEETKSGKQYKDLPHRSSAPEEAPADQSGEVRSLGEYEPLIKTFEVTEGTDVAGQIGAKVSAGDGSGLAEYLEFGTSKMAPRPFFGPAEVTGAEAVVVANEELAKKLSTL